MTAHSAHGLLLHGFHLCVSMCLWHSAFAFKRNWAGHLLLLDSFLLAARSSKHSYCQAPLFFRAAGGPPKLMIAPCTGAPGALHFRRSGDLLLCPRSWDDEFGRAKRRFCCCTRNPCPNTAAKKDFHIQWSSDRGDKFARSSYDIRSLFDSCDRHGYAYRYHYPYFCQQHHVSFWCSLSVKT